MYYVAMAESETPKTPEVSTPAVDAPKPKRSRRKTKAAPDVEKTRPEHESDWL